MAKIGRKWAAPGLVLQAAPRPVDGAPAAGPRVGFTASRKVGGAVLRNRARRRLREAAEVVLAPAARADRDFVLIARAATPTRPYAALIADLRQALDEVAGRRVP